MTDIILEQINQAYIRVRAEQSILHELSDRFTFEVPGARFSPAFKKKHWDGKTRLLSTKTGNIFAGLSANIASWAYDNDYTLEDNTDTLTTDKFSLQEAYDFIQTLNLPIKPRPYQIQAFAYAIRYRRTVLISPTGSGKSLIAYLIVRYLGGKALIVVPTISLVMQLQKDFADYGYTDPIHGIMAGVEKDSPHDITVSTWQSIFDMSAKWFRQFDVFIGDEAHNYKAKSLIKIMTSMHEVKHRIGMTGTLDGAEVNALVLEGLFGRIEKIVDTSELMAAGQLAPLKIKVLVLKHQKEAKKKMHGCTYQEEVDYIVSCDDRNKFIRNLALSLKGNTLVLFSYVDKHGRILYDLIKDKANHENVFWVSGEVKATDREGVREFVETTDNSIIVASYGVFSVGVNMRRINNIVFASPTKSRIRTLQSIGRGLRTLEGKTECKLFDIADDISHNKKNNYTLNHLKERVIMYNMESFPYELHTIDLGDK